MIHLNEKQIEKLSDLFMDLAKGLFLGGFALSIVNGIDYLALLQYFISGILGVYFSLNLIKKKE